MEEVGKTRRPIRVTRFAKPVAEVIPPSPPETTGRRLGSMVGTGTIIGDIVGPTGNWDDWEASRGSCFSTLTSGSGAHSNHSASAAAWKRRWQILGIDDGGLRLAMSELIVLLRKGRLTLPNDVAAWFAKTMQDLELTEAPFTVEVALVISSISFLRGNPADHLLAATAKVF